MNTSILLIHVWFIHGCWYPETSDFYRDSEDNALECIGKAEEMFITFKVRSAAVFNLQH